VRAPRGNVHAGDPYRTRSFSSSLTRLHYYDYQSRLDIALFAKHAKLIHALSDNRGRISAKISFDVLRHGRLHILQNEHACLG
jgi:hypothetical protein